MTQVTWMPPTQEEVLSAYERMYVLTRDTLRKLLLDIAHDLFAGTQDHRLRILAVNAGTGMIVERAILYAVLANVHQYHPMYVSLRIAYFAERTNGDHEHAKLSYLTDEGRKMITDRRDKSVSELLDHFGYGDST